MKCDARLSEREIIHDQWLVKRVMLASGEMMLARERSM